MTEELFFVGLKKHVGVRRELLNSSKSALDMLKRYEQYNLLKQDKVEMVFELKRVFDELLVLNKKLKGKLPKVPVKVPSAKFSPPKTKERPKTVVRKAPSKLELLEKELAKVENRLAKLR